MLSLRLFLGFPVDDEFAHALSKVAMPLADFFIGEGHDYLKEVIHDEKRYLGKYTDVLSDFSKLRLLEANIYSLLEKLVPDYPCQKVPLVLLPVSES